MEEVKFYFDPRCPWCYLTSRWAVQLERLGEISLSWGPLPLDVVHAEEGTDLESIDAKANVGLRIIMVLRHEGHEDKIGPFYTALGKRIWEVSPPPEDRVAASREALTDIGLDPEICDRALADQTAWGAVLHEFNALVQRTESFGVPTIVLDDGIGPAIFGPVISELPHDDATARELWRHVSWLARYENFSELKRERTAPPNLPGHAWIREQRALERSQREQ